MYNVYIFNFLLDFFLCAFYVSAELHISDKTQPPIEKPETIPQLIFVLTLHVQT